jgi:pilus assembly protein TadC
MMPSGPATDPILAEMEAADARQRLRNKYGAPSAPRQAIERGVIRASRITPLLVAGVFIVFYLGALYYLYRGIQAVHGWP